MTVQKGEREREGLPPRENRWGFVFSFVCPYGARVDGLWQRCSQVWVDSKYYFHGRDDDLGNGIEK